MIELPKAVRNSSVQVENQEILFTGTYENGVLASPTIYLKFADSTENDDVTVTITNGKTLLCQSNNKLQRVVYLLN